MLRVVCTGGGAKGAFYAGVWKAKKELGITEVERYGTSIGAVNMVLEGLGYDLEWVWKEKMVLKRMVMKVIIAMIRGKDWRKAISLRHVYKELIDDIYTFDHLDARTFVTATSLETASAYTFGHLLGDKLLPAMLASSAYPVLFSPIKYRGLHLLDGGLVDNIPFPNEDRWHPSDVTIVVALCDVTPQIISPEFPNLKGFKRILAEALATWEVFANKETMKELGTWDESKRGKLILIALEDEDMVGGFDFSQTERLIQKGYEQGLDALLTHLPSEYINR